MPISEWYFVTFDDRVIRLRVEPPEREAWDVEIAWNSIVRICFLAQDFTASDEIYLFTSARPESYVIPTEARGGDAFWGEILRRKLFDASMAIEAATTEGKLFCWPPGSVQN